MPCAICDDTGWKTIEVEGVPRVMRCDCWYERTGRDRLLTARIPRRYAHCELSNFETHYDSLRDAHRKATRFVEVFPAPQRGLLLIGANGVGKTHLAVAVLKDAIRRKGARGYFYEAPELLKLVRDSYDASRSQGELEVLEPVLRSDLLVLDDLGEERTSEWVQETLGHIINVRYSENRPTIFTTNLVDSPDSTHPKSFIFKLGPRSRSRLIEMCDWVYMDAIDSREVGPNPTPAQIAEWQEKSPASPKNVEKVKRGLPPRASGQLKSRLRSAEPAPDLKWTGGKAGS